MADPEQVIEIHDSAINVEAIMERIRQRIRERQVQAEARGLDYYRLVDDKTTLPDSGRLSADLYYDLHQLRTSADSLWVSVALYDSRLPLINSWYMRVKGKLHGIVVDYINRLAGRQVAFNRTNEHALAQIVTVLENFDSRLTALEQQLAERDNRANPNSAS